MIGKGEDVCGCRWCLCRRDARRLERLVGELGLLVSLPSREKIWRMF